MPDFNAYHGATGAEHQQKFNQLSGQGFRMISLSVYDSPSNPRYAAVWVKRSGPAWAAVHGVDAAGYQNAFNTWTAKGYVPSLVTATGTAGNAIFAAMFEKVSIPGWLAKHGLISGPDNNPSTFQYYNKWAKANGFILRTAAIYGTTFDRRYAAVWVPSSGNTQWTYRSSDSATEYQKWFDAWTQVPYRPSYVTLSDDQIYLSMFRGDSIGPWVARHGMTSAAYQIEFDKQVAAGFYPICVQGGGSGSKTRYAAIFAQQETPIARKWSVTGQGVASLAAFDAATKEFMQKCGIRAGTLAIAKNGVIKYARAFTWAEPDYPVTQPNSLFRLASCSKAFACAAIQKLYDEKKLTPTTTVFPLLGITSKALATQTPSQWINTITVQQLVDHAGGWDRDLYPDPVFNMRNIARALGLSSAPSKMDLARFMYGEPLQYKPGTTSIYCNFGYVLMGLCVEKVTGKAFIDYLKQNILTPEGINDVFLGRTLRSQRRANEVQYDGNGVGLTPLNPQTEVLAPVCYGGEGWLTESMDTGGGLIATATAMTQFINKHAVWGLGGRMAGAARSGGMAGVASLAVSRGDGVDYCYIFQTRNFLPAPADALKDYGDKLTQLLNTTPIPAGAPTPRGKKFEFFKEEQSGPEVAVVKKKKRVGAK